MLADVFKVRLVFIHEIVGPGPVEYLNRAKASRFAVLHWSTVASGLIPLLPYQFHG
jgi:hypothetical protein